MQEILKHVIFEDPVLLDASLTCGYSDYYLCSEFYILDSNAYYYKIVYVIQRPIDVLRVYGKKFFKQGEYFNAQNYEHNGKVKRGDFFVQYKTKKSNTLDSIMEEINKRLNSKKSVPYVWMWEEDADETRYYELYCSNRKECLNYKDKEHYIDYWPWPACELEWMLTHEYDEDKLKEDFGR